MRRIVRSLRVDYTLYLSALIVCTALEVFTIKCKTICAQDGDEYGTVIDDKCVCGNVRDMSKVVFKLGNLKGKSVTTPTPPTYFVY